MTLPVAYAFQARFRLDARPAEVFAAVVAPEVWLAAEPHVRTLTCTAPGDPAGIGRRYEVCVRSRPYCLRWTMTAVEVQAPTAIAWRAGGDLAGTGRWRLAAHGRGCEVASSWRVRTTPRWMRWSGPLLRPLFVRNHDTAMRTAVEALARHLDVAVSWLDVTAVGSGPSVTTGPHAH